MALTAKEERFATLVALEGYTQHDAYLEAYDVLPDTKASSINEQAYVLSKTLHISSRIAELRAATASPKIATLKRRKEHATEVMDDGKAGRRDQLAANRLIGDYQKDFVQRTESVNLNINADLMSIVELLRGMALTTEQLDVLDAQLAKLGEVDPSPP
jgi:hypothetical protein